MFAIMQEILNEIKKLILGETIAIPGVKIARKEAEVYGQPCFTEPLMSLTVQGQKIISVGDQDLNLVAGTILVTCVDIPNTASILYASPQCPFLGVIVYLNRQIMADIISDLNYASSSGDQELQSTDWVMKANDEFLDAFLRLCRLFHKPEYVPILAPLIIRELHFLLLLSPVGTVLRHLYMHGGRDRRIIDVIGWLKKHLDARIAMEDLARKAHMSVSSFHRHFKALTGLTPLQYHKNLRLYEAQRLMLSEERRVSEASMAVGYESVAQFNREYRRMFGAPPRRDVLRRIQKLKKI